MVISGVSPLLRLFAVFALLLGNSNVVARKSSRSSTVSRAHPSKPRSTTRRKASGSRPSSPASHHHQQYEDEEDEYSEDDYSDDEELLAPRSRKRSNNSSRAQQSKQTGRPPNRGLSTRSSSRRIPDYDQYEEDYYDSQPSQSSRVGRGREPPRRGRRGQMVAYSNQPAAFTRGLTALRNSLPDPGIVKEKAFSSISAARETTSRLSSNLYRDIKGLTSSELEQVMLKATRPDDTPVKGKHVERLVGVTYQVSPRYDIYDAVLRKLWAKMAEKDWRTKIKALYVLHRYSADGAPEHHDRLKTCLREFRRKRDEKRKGKFFNSKQLLAGETNSENVKFRSFMSRYAHYVLLRAQSFGGVFEEISAAPRISKKTPKPITSTALRAEYLKAARTVLEFGINCLLKEGEECENTAIAVERVAGDLIGLSTAVAISLNRALKNDDLLKGSDKALLKKWCEFYSEELLPKTRSMVKKTSPKLDAYGLYLPSRMRASVSQEILQKGLKLVEEEEESLESDDEFEKKEVKTADNAETGREKEVAEKIPKEAVEDEEEEDATNDDGIEELYDDYEESEFDYDGEYYDDEEE